MPILCLSPAISQTGVEENAGINLSLISCSWSNPPPPLFKILSLTQKSAAWFILVIGCKPLNRIARCSY